jgi:hypothetical protein
LSCLYLTATEHEDYSELEQKAELLHIDNFDALKEVLSNL